MSLLKSEGVFVMCDTPRLMLACAASLRILFMQTAEIQTQTVRGCRLIQFFSVCTCTIMYTCVSLGRLMIVFELTVCVIYKLNPVYDWVFFAVYFNCLLCTANIFCACPGTYAFADCICLPFTALC